MVIVVISFAICWGPFNIITITADIMPSVYSQQYVKVIWLFSQCLAIGNSGINPILYGWMKKNYRREYRNFAKKLLCMSIRKQHRNIRKQHSNSTVHSKMATSEL